MQQPENGKDASQPEMKESDHVFDPEEDDLLDEEWVVNESGDGQVTVNEINKEASLPVLCGEAVTVSEIAMTSHADAIVTATMEQNWAKSAEIAGDLSPALDAAKGNELEAGMGRDVMEEYVSKEKEQIAGLVQGSCMAGDIDSAAVYSKEDPRVPDETPVASCVHGKCAAGGTAAMVLDTKLCADSLVLAPGEKTEVASGALPACAIGGVEDDAVGDPATLDGGEEKTVDYPETPSFALGPLLEKAINELKGSKDASKKIVTDGSSAENKVAKPVKVTTPISNMSTPLRRSVRRAGSVDEDSTDRASRMVAKRNLDDTEVSISQTILRM
ncbi:hypothetical protein EJB05_18541, partial [Eragrostis curvula]